MNLNERLEYERQFIKNNKILIVGDDSSKNLIDRIDYTFENYEKFLIVYIQEIFRSKKIISYIHKKVKETNKEVLISSATTTDDFLFTHPITNLYFWQGLFSKSKLSWNSPSILQFDKKYYTNESKQIKGILSVRKQNEERDVLFSDIKEFDGIFRYISFPAYIGDESDEIINSTSHFPNWKNLIKEYTQSYISFIIESMNG